MPNRPTIVLTLGEARTAADPALAARRNELYLDAVRRHGGEPIALDPSSGADERQAAFRRMSGLVLTGGGDIDPARYDRANDGSHEIEPQRDALDAAAWAAAERAGLPVLGICRGLQAVNVFSGGTLLQDVAGHRGPAWGTGPALTHPLRLLPGTRLARILGPTGAGGATLAVNSYHHQAVRPADLAPGLVAAGLASSPEGELVEALEAAGPRLVLAVQCHPERTDSTPPAFERLWRFFVDACRGAVRTRARAG